MTAGRGPARAGKTIAESLLSLRDLAPRLVSAIVLAGAALATLWKGGDFFVVFWLLAALAVQWEWQSLIDAPRPTARLALGWALTIVLAFAARHRAFDISGSTLIIGIVALGWLAGPGKRAWGAFGIVYAGALVMSVIALRLSLNGFEAIIWLFAVVWGTDVGAYFGGRLIGGPKLWPSVSPSKTWAGFLVGVSCGAMAGLLALAAVGGLAVGSWPGVVAMGFACAIISQCGDLFESGIKRHFRAKDSGSLIPGHGGFMDRLDGFIAAAVFAAVVGTARVGPLEVAIGVLRW